MPFSLRPYYAKHFSKTYFKITNFYEHLICNTFVLQDAIKINPCKKKRNLIIYNMNKKKKQVKNEIESSKAC